MSSWYKNNEGGIVVSSRVRLARNLADMPFPRRMNGKALAELCERVKRAISEASGQIGEELRFIEMDNIPDSEIAAMVERHIISREFAENRRGRAIAISDDERVCIMVGEEDHIRIQVLGGGLSLDEVYEKADRIDTALGNILSFAYDSEFGYLTECPTNIGTGLRASVMLHLPLCTDTNKISSIAEAVGKIGFTVRGMYGEGSGSEAGLYQISNQITLGISEKNAIENLKVIASQIVEREENARLKVSRIRLEDAVCRALGTAGSARLVSTDELMQLISRIKLGCDMGILDIGRVNPLELLITLGVGALQSKHGEMEPAERDELRARLLREKLNYK